MVPSPQYVSAGEQLDDPQVESAFPVHRFMPKCLQEIPSQAEQSSFAPSGMAGCFSEPTLQHLLLGAGAGAGAGVAMTLVLAMPRMMRAISPKLPIHLSRDVRRFIVILQTGLQSEYDAKPAALR